MEPREDHETEPYQGCVRTQYNDESDSEKSNQAIPEDPKNEISDNKDKEKNNQPEIVDQKSSKCCLLV